MDSHKILSADLLDILFEGKNKQYGAYQLRKTYNKRIAIAVGSVSLLCLLLFISHLFAIDNAKGKNTITVTDVDLKDVKKPEEKKIDPPPVQPKKIEQPRVEITRFTPPEIVKDIDVKETPPDVEKLEDTQIGLINKEGVKDENFVAPPIEQGTGNIEAPKTKVVDYDITFTKVELEARFPDGMEAWKRYLERNLNAGVAAEDGAPVGNYTVKVQFVVDKEGNISDVHAIEVPKACPACGPEAVKVIKNGPKWEPAIQNATKVKYQAVQYITFQVAEE